MARSKVIVAGTMLKLSPLIPPIFRIHFKIHGKAAARNCEYILCVRVAVRQEPRERVDMDCRPVGP